MSKKINLDFKQAPAKTIAFLKEKKITTSFDYKDLEKEAHLKAFTVAKIMQLDVVADIQSSLLTAMKEGKSFKKWKKEIKPLLVKKGWYGEKEVINPSTGEIKTTYVGSRRLKTIFETNMRTAHAAGRANNIYSNLNEYLQYHAILDSQTREDHKAYNGIVKHRDDKFWINNFPPNGWGCRCYITSLSKKDLERKDLKVDNKDYKDFADSDFSYDLRNLGFTNLQNTYYKKVQDISKNCIELNAKKVPCPFTDTVKKNYKENIKKTLPSKKEFDSFIDRALDKDIKRHNYITAGYLSLIPNVMQFLEKKKISPKSDIIMANTGNIRNLQAKKDSSKKGKVLETQEIKALLDKFQEPDAVYFDGSILIVFDSFTDDKLNKIVIKLDFETKKEIYNNIHSGIKLEELKDLDSYEVVYKKK